MSLLRAELSLQTAWLYDSVALAISPLTAELSLQTAWLYDSVALAISPLTAELFLDNTQLYFLFFLVGVFLFGFFFVCVPQLYLWGLPLLGEIFAYVTVF